MKCRIREACARLRTGRHSVARVAFDLGFCDQSNFTRHFRRHTGVTPTAYLRQPAAARGVTTVGAASLPPTHHADRSQALS